MRNGDYIIIGDGKEYKDCLVYVCGSLEWANEVLNRMLTNPTEDDKRMLSIYSNLRVAFEEEKDCWWHGNCE